MSNEKTISVDVTRRELIDLKFACFIMANEHAYFPNSIKWKELHDNLDEILKDFDNEEE